MLEFIKSYMSDIVSVLGVGLTVFFAIGAKNAAEAAQDASNKTRLRLGNLEASDLIKDCINGSVSVIEKIEAESWDIVSHTSTNVRRSLVSLKHNTEELLDEEHNKSLGDAIIQFGILTSQADKIRMNDLKSYKRTTYISTIHAQVDALIVIQEHIRKKLGEEL